MGKLKKDLLNIVKNYIVVWLVVFEKTRNSKKKE